MALVLGAILVVSGPTAIIPLLRHAKLAPEPAAVLKWEGIVNDPVGAVLAVVVLRFAIDGVPQNMTSLAVPALAVVAAGILGFAVGRVIGVVYRRGHLAEYLKGPVVLGLALTSYTVGNLLQPEAGLVTVTVLGVTLANTDLIGIEHLRRLNEYLVVLLISGMFVVLTAAVDPAMFGALNWGMVAFLAAALFLVRPISVALATIGSGLGWRHRLLVGWIAPRGIVVVVISGLFAPVLIDGGYPAAERMVPLAIAVVFTSVVLHGFWLRWLARRLGLAAGPGHGALIIGAAPWSTRLARALNDAGARVLVADTNRHALAAARRAGIATYPGEILSESAANNFDLTPYDHVVAATDNDAYNTLVCRQFGHTMGRTHVYQVAGAVAVSDGVRGVDSKVRGLTLMDPKIDGEELEHRVLEGRRFARWTIPKEIPKADLPKEPVATMEPVEAAPPAALEPVAPAAPAEPVAAAVAAPLLLVAPEVPVSPIAADALLVAVVRPSGEIVFNVGGAAFAPAAGDTVLYFAPPKHRTEPGVQP